MRLVLDECIDERLRHAFSGHDCQTARYAHLAGLKNGRLLLVAESAGFDVIITVDQKIPDQQNLWPQRRAAYYLCTHKPPSRPDAAHSCCAAALDAMLPGQVVRIS